VTYSNKNWNFFGVSTKVPGLVLYLQVPVQHILVPVRTTSSTSTSSKGTEATGKIEFSDSIQHSQRPRSRFKYK
jgi:hypothetical protein